MRLFLLIVLTFFAFSQQSQPPSPAPSKATNTDQKQRKPEQQQTPINEQVGRDLVTAVNQLTAEIATKNQQNSTTPNKDESSAKWWSVANSILVTIFTGVLAFLAVLQWKAMHRQADIADRQEKIVGRQADIAAEQLEITKAAESRHDAESAMQEMEAIRERRRSDARYSDQLEFARENTAIAKKSADAALLNAQAVINSERPWIRIRGQCDSDRCVFMAKCYGRTPANIVEIRSQSLIIETFKKPPTPATYTADNRLIYSRLVTQEDEAFAVFDYPIEALREHNKLDWEPIFNLTKTLWFFGKIVYTDAMSKDAIGNPIQHVTAWCFSYSPGNFIMRDGPSGYNEYT